MVDTKKVVEDLSRRRRDGNEIEVLCDDAAW